MTPDEQDAADRARAYDLVKRQGKTLSAVGKLMKVSRETARKWVAQVEAERSAPAAGSAFLARLAVEHAEREKAASTPPGPPTGPEGFDLGDDAELGADVLEVDDESIDAMSVLKRAIRSNRELARAAAADGNMTIVSRCNRDLIGLVNHLKGLEKAQRTDENTLHVSRADIETAWESVLEKSRAVCEKPLLCAECGRKIAVLMAEGKQ
jgi:hypothetical protein